MLEHTLTLSVHPDKLQCEWVSLLIFFSSFSCATYLKQARVAALYCWPEGKQQSSSDLLQFTIK